jgi:glycosyltransferase involved in cell wall biosynthesis
VHVDQPSRPARLAWEQTALPLLLRRLRIDVLHSPHHHTPLLGGFGAGRPGQVVTFHDVTFLLLPKRYSLVRRLYMEALTRAAARRADAIIAPSQSARADVVRALGRPAERVVVIPEAAAPSYQPVRDDDQIASVRARYSLPDRFVLSVGSLEPGKNRSRLIRACAALHGTRFGCPLIVVGQPAWAYEGDYALVRDLGMRDAVRFLGYVPDVDMPALYSAATLFAFPSLHEGFGLPVLEAMACGTPVVTSNVSATAEVAGDAALLVDPRDTDAITGALGRLLSDGWLRAELRDRGFERAKQFSWERTARETRSVYEVVAAKRKADSSRDRL